MKRDKNSKPKIKKSFFDMSGKEMEALLKEAAAEAIAETHAAGLPTTHGDEKGVYRLYPDGRKEYITRYEKGGSMEVNRPSPEQILNNIKARLPQLESVLRKYSGEWGYEDHVYRFYHQSAKVFYRTQRATRDMVAALQSVCPDGRMNERFLRIISEGTERSFTAEANSAWLEHTRPILEAFFHARFFLEMVIKYASLPSVPAPYPSGWGCIDYLYRYTKEACG